MTWQRSITAHGCGAIFLLKGFLHMDPYGMFGKGVAAFQFGALMLEMARMVVVVVRSG